MLCFKQLQNIWSWYDEQLMNQFLFLFYFIEMASFNDALKRLQIIYNDTAGDQKTKKGGKELDEFARLKRDLHNEVKAVRHVSF